MLKSSRLGSGLHSDPFRLPVPQEHGEAAGRGDDRRQPEPALAGGGAAAQKTQGTVCPLTNIKNAIYYNILSIGGLLYVCTDFTMVYIAIYLPVYCEVVK